MAQLKEESISTTPRSSTSGSFAPRRSSPSVFEKTCGTCTGLRIDWRGCTWHCCMRRPRRPCRIRSRAASAPRSPWSCCDRGTAQGTFAAARRVARTAPPRKAPSCSTRRCWRLPASRTCGKTITPWRCFTWKELRARWGTPDEECLGMRACALTMGTHFWCRPCSTRWPKPRRSPVRRGQRSSTWRSRRPWRCEPLHSASAPTCATVTCTAGTGDSASKKRPGSSVPGG
mmetsp:Transcript_123696/g.395784  ORF Transcript_123696/g.395784 Transcript_123696/m.395784 type:complete len:230 (-) Transcript_123696:4115-4804(-)